LTAVEATAYCETTYEKVVDEFGRETAEQLLGPHPATRVKHRSIGFRSAEHLDIQFERHRYEFGDPTREDYLRRAQQLRDESPYPGLLSATRSDGSMVKFDILSNRLVTFDPDLTLRAYFCPNDGLECFERLSR
jgi:pyocin large subunit-like protein